MEDSRGILKPEDYAEPRCVLCDDPYGTVPESKPVPQDRIIAKFDEYISRRDYDGGRRHLEYWLEEAMLGNDLRGQLVIRNELTGHFRKTGDREKAFENAQEALRLLDRLDFDGTISSGTTYTNAATAYHAFGEYDLALSLFEKARRVYEASPVTRPELLGGLYNNMALTCVALKKYEEAQQLYNKALKKMAEVPGGELEQAITYLNMADVLEAGHRTENEREQAEAVTEEEAGIQEQINNLAEKAYELLDSSAAPRDGYYAFVCEKCSPVFSYYGYFIEAEELNRRANAIYEANKGSAD